MQAPSPTSDVPGLQARRQWQVLEPIGSGRDPLKVFTVAQDVDGRSAIRISGEAFGELRSKASFKNYHLKLQFKWGEKKWPPRDGRRRSATAVSCTTSTPNRARRGERGRDRSSCRSRNTTSAISTPSDRRLPFAPRSAAGTTPPLYDYDPAGEWMFFSQSHGLVRPLHQAAGQREADRRVEHRRARSPSAMTAIHIVNGKVVMRLHEPMRIDTRLPTPVTSGPIILQSEGAEVFYRDIQVRPIKAIPAEYMEKR